MKFCSAITILKVSVPHTIFVVTLKRYLNYTGHVLTPEVSYTYTFTVTMKLKACFTWFSTFQYYKWCVNGQHSHIYLNAYVTFNPALPFGYTILVPTHCRSNITAGLERRPLRNIWRTALWWVLVPPLLAATNTLRATGCGPLTMPVNPVHTPLQAEVFGTKQ